MLIELERAQLARLLQRYSFEHLRPSPLSSVVIPEEEVFLQSASEERRRRKIFYGVSYELEEVAKVEEVRRLLREAGVAEPINDELVLKHIYAGKWDSGRALERIREVIAFNSSPVVTRLDEETIKKLEGGAVYTYGYDRSQLPLVVMRVDRIDFKAPLEEVFNAVYYLMLVVKAYKMRPYHAEKLVLLVDFNDISLASIPYFRLYDILRRMGTYYCGLTERAFLYNSAGVGKIWKLVYGFLPEHQKKKVVFVQKGEERKVLQWVDAAQLERRYGGSLPDLHSFWPPSEAAHPSDSDSSQTYYSVENNLEFFEPPTPPTCGTTCSCAIY